MSVKLGTLLHVWGDCLNNVQFYFGNNNDHKLLFAR
jgi:hypothetical protein